MIGFRGASRYYDPRYQAGFALECRAMKKVRDEMGLTNLKLMIPFCRTVEEGRSVQAEMEKHGLKRGVNGLEIYVMCEIPSNVILAEEFAEIFDGFSIGSNDLTQLILGVDRDSEIVAPHLRRAERRREKDDRPGHRRLPRERPQDRHLRPGAERLSGLRAVPRRARHRQHLAQSRHGAEDDAGDFGERKRPRPQPIKKTSGQSSAELISPRRRARRWRSPR